MTNYSLLFIIFLASFLLAIGLTKLVIILAKRFQILDLPQSDSRKIHTSAIPLAGGWAIYLAWLLVVLVLWQSHILFDQRFDPSLLFWFFIAGLVLMVNGLIDDKLNLPAKKSIWGPILAIVIMLVAGLKISYISNPSGGIIYLAGFGALGLIITFIWLLVMTYTTKLLDGLDGLTSSTSLIACLIIFMVSLSWDVRGSTTSLLTISLAGAILGFLVWNWQPAKIFLGEGGSTFLGFALGVLALISGSKIATALLVMGLPFLDIIIVIGRRLKKHQAIWQGDQEHLHFRLLAAGLSQRQTVLFLSLISLLFGSIALFSSTKLKILALALLLLFVLVLSWRLNQRLKVKNL